MHSKQFWSLLSHLEKCIELIKRHLICTHIIISIETLVKLLHLLLRIYSLKIVATRHIVEWLTLIIVVHPLVKSELVHSVSIMPLIEVIIIIVVLVFVMVFIVPFIVVMTTVTIILLIMVVILLLLWKMIRIHLLS